MERKKRSSVISGSVWETRMRNDEIMGGFKVFNEKKPEENNSSEKKLKSPEEKNNSSERKIKTPVGRRKTWKNDNLVQIAVKKSVDLKSKSIDFEEVKKRSFSSKKFEECEKSSVESVKNCNGIEKGFAESGGISNVFDDSKNEQKKAFFGSKNEFIDEVEKSSDEINMGLGQYEENSDIFEESRKVAKKVVLNEQKNAKFSGLVENEKKAVEVMNNGFEKGLVQIEESSDFFEESKKVLNEEKRVKIDEFEKEGSNLSENGNNSSNVKSGPNLENTIEGKKGEKKSIHVEKLNEVKKLNLKKEKPLPIITSPVVKKQSPSTAKLKAIPDFDRIESQSNQTRIPQNHGKLQSLIDLVMWKDASRSTFIFGIGTFIIISSCYTKDLNISLISIFAYLGLVYLATIFIFRSIILRGVIDTNDTSEDYVIGEEEAMWLLKKVLPYLNECLVKIKALFSGDPATTMKLAVMLYILARCGGSITIWKMTKLGFFAIFTVPKICSLYSTHLTAYGKFWIRRFIDAWDSCSHKKAVGFGIFTFFWNFSSVVARIWAVFMLLVAFKYYQQSVVTNDDYVEQDDEQKCEISLQGHVGGRRLRQHGPIHGVTSTTRRKEKILSTSIHTLVA